MRGRGRWNRNHPTILKAPNTSTMLGMGEGGGRALVNFLKMKEGEGGRAGGKHPTLFKSYRHHVNTRGGEVLSGKSWESLPRGTVFW